MDMDQGASKLGSGLQRARRVHKPVAEERSFSRRSADRNRQDPTVPGMYEFEVVTGNAAYREGERFYLTPAQAQRVYFLGKSAGAGQFGNS